MIESSITPLTPTERAVTNNWLKAKCREQNLTTVKHLAEYANAGKLCRDTNIGRKAISEAADVCLAAGLPATWNRWSGAVSDQIEKTPDLAAEIASLRSRLDALEAAMKRITGDA